MNAKSYKILRDYVKNVSGQTATQLDGAIGEAIGQSEKTIQNISSGKRAFRWGEAKRAAEEFVLNVNEDCDKKVLYSLIRDFLHDYGLSDSNAEVTEEDIDSYIVDLLNIESHDDSGEDIFCVQSRYNNLPELLFTGTIIRNELHNQIKKAISEQKIIFLSGITGTGKSFISKAIAQELFEGDNNNKYMLAIWSDCETGTASLNDIIIDILCACGVKYTGNMTKEEKYKASEEYMRMFKGILVIDAFEKISTRGNDVEELFQFITEKIPNNWVVIITCNKRLSLYRKYIRTTSRFSELRVEKLSYEEWVELSKAKADSLGDVKEAKEAFPYLDKYVYELCRGNAYVMMHVLAAVSEKLLTGTSFERIKNEYDLLDIDEDSYQVVFEKTLGDLSQNCLNILITMSLFATPITSQMLSLISGIDGIENDGSVKAGSDLEQSISICHNLYMIDRYIKNEKFRFCLPEMLQPILSRLIRDKQKEYNAIIKRWISYYIDFSYQIGFCFDDFNKLTELDCDSNAKEIDNIIRVLDYCYLMNLWEEYYIISENTKYFFYTRGISGEGKESIHYKRACAARKIGNEENEFESLLYHCNVMCKTKAWQGLDECFLRMDELIKDSVCIAERSQQKYIYLLALYSFSRGSYEDANTYFEKYEKDIKSLIEATGEEHCDRLIIHDYIASLRWHCECTLAQIDFNNINSEIKNTVIEIDSVLNEAIRLAKKVNFERAIVHSILIKIRMGIELSYCYSNIMELFDMLDEYQTVIENDAIYRKMYNYYKQQVGKEDE